MDTVVSNRLPVTWYSAASSGEPLLQVPITDKAGGTAYQFARGALRLGLQPTIVGCIGEDAAAELIIDELTSAGIAHRLQRSASAPTARSLVVFDAHGVRFMFTSSVNANDELSAEFVRCVGPQRWDLVWLSGLCLRSRAAPRFLAVAGAVAHARK
ncbi:MAG: carbohydrate kinase family protein, partial [Pseudonocardiaceae bacterium]